MHAPILSALKVSLYFRVEIQIQEQLSNINEKDLFYNAGLRLHCDEFFSVADHFPISAITGQYEATRLCETHL